VSKSHIRPRVSIGIGCVLMLVAISVPASATADFWGTRNAGINYGMLFTAWNVAGVIGPRIGGVLFDRYHNYQAAFYPAAVLAAVVLICEMLVRRPAAPQPAV